MTTKGIIDEYKIAIINNTPPQGVGSVASSVEKSGTIDYIKELVIRLNIKTVCDCPCGLYENWINLVNLPLLGVTYFGYDINDLVIERNSKKYSELNFFEFNMHNEILPQCDLIICRDCLFHFPNELVIKTLDNFKKSNSKYLLATEHNWVQQNKDLTSSELNYEWGYRDINLEIEPFSLGNPIEYHNEDLWNRCLSLWEINKK